MTTWFTSDEHVGHIRIIEYSARPFLDVDEMRRELVARHNAVVRDGDTVYHLGDVTMRDQYVQAYVAELRGTHLLIPGNHDACHPCHSKHEPARRKYLQWGFADVLPLTIEYSLPGFGPVLVSHMPYVGDHTDQERHAKWRPIDAGLPLLHGHVHEKWLRSGNQINVGVDQWNYAPVSEAQLVALLTSAS